MRWINLIALWPVILAASFVCSCKHDPLVDCDPISPIVEKDTCVDFDSATAECAGGVVAHDLEPAFIKPCYNPLNSSEFVYMTDGKLYKYNLETGNKSLVLEGVPIIGQLDWSVTGWLTFSTLQWKVWKAKDDGTEKAQLSFTPNDQRPKFNPEGMNIMYYRSMEYSNAELQANPSLYKRYKMITIDLEGNFVDTLCKLIDTNQCAGWGVYDWSSDDLIASEYYQNGVYGAAIYNLNGELLNRLYETNLYDGRDHIIDIEWHADNQHIFLTDGYGIKMINLSSKDIQIIKESCDARYYEYISISSDGQFILAQRGTSEVRTICDIDRQWEIVRMDIDGSNEVVIDLE